MARTGVARGLARLPTRQTPRTRGIRRTSSSLCLALMSAAFGWRGPASRALVAGIAATDVSGYGRTARCGGWSDHRPSAAACAPSRQSASRLTLGFQRRYQGSCEGSSEGTSRRFRAGDQEPTTRDLVEPLVEETAAVPGLNHATRSARKFRAGLSRVFSAVGFLSSSTTSLFTDREQLQRLRVTVDAFQHFLTSSGIDEELSESLNLRLLDNLIILGRVQKAALLDSDIRDLVAPEVAPADVPPPEEWYRYMRYATAAYGPAMIRAAEMDVTGKFDTRFVNKPIIKTRMSEHVGIPEEDMAVLDVDYDGNSMHLRYFVAVDHSNRKVVLAVRGTFSLSEIICDVAAFSRPFCGGEAHSEMATVAERTWEVVGPTILEQLEKHPDYELILTGHSLGAGCAALLNIMCHENGNALVNGRSVRCFAYACPPVFAPLENAPRAIKACTSFTNEMDVVPFLSVDSVRHVFASIRAIEELNLPWRERMKLVTGFAEPDETLAEAVGRANRMRLTPKHGAPVLSVPAQATIWLREKDHTGSFTAKICDPKKISRTPIQIDVNMLQDHFASRYEHVLHHLEPP